MPDAVPPVRKAATNGKPRVKQKKRHTGDRFGVANAFADCGARNVSTTAQAVWWILWRETKPNGLARISFNQIAECVGVSRLTVIRAIGQLTKTGLVEVVQRGDLRHGSSSYRAHGITPNRERA